MKYEVLITVQAIKEFFRRYKRVRNVKINDEVGIVNIYIKSWIPLSKKQYKEIIENKPVAIMFRIYNQYLFGESNKNII